MIDPSKVNADVSIKEPVNVVVEIKEKNKKEEEHIFGLSAGYLDLIKWFLSSVVLLILGPYITNKIQKTQLIIENRKDSVTLEINRLNADSKLIESVSSKFDLAETDSCKSHLKEANYLQFIETFVTTDTLIKNINRRIYFLNTALQSQKSGSLNRQDSLISRDSTKFTSSQKNGLIGLIDSTPLKSKPISDYVSQVDKFIKDSNIKRLSNQPTDSILRVFQKINLISTPVKSDNNYYLISQAQTQWCKKGYYIEFNNTLHIDIINLDVRTQKIKIDLKDSDGKQDSPSVIQNNLTLSVGQVITQYNANYRYEITLNYIGHAGKNPFTKAAYITVATYKKS